jgi:hypothetical protein
LASAAREAEIPIPTTPTLLVSPPPPHWSAPQAIDYFALETLHVALEYRTSLNCFLGRLTLAPRHQFLLLNRVLAITSLEQYVQDMSAINRNRPHSTIARTIGLPIKRRTLLVPPDGKTINFYLPMELLREVFLYSIVPNQMKSGRLASVCRYWRSVITTMAHLWSTLRVGTWTETEQVVTWLQRAYPKKVIIDPQRDSENPSEAPMFAALQKSLTSTGEWNELTISSFPPENLASQFGVQVASPMNVLKVLHIAAGCVHSSSFAHLLNLVPPEAPLCELRLHPPFVSTYFLQPHWIPVLQNLTVLIVNGRDIHQPFELLPTFTNLQIFEADRLRIPFYEPNASLPLLCTLRKLQLRSCSIQWMAGRQFPHIEECAVFLPRHWEAIHQLEVQLPSCKKLAYHGYPMTTAQYFLVPEMRAMDLRSHDCNEQRAYQHLRHLCRVDGSIPSLTTLHLTFQCSEQVLIKVLKYLVPLRELSLSIAHPSPSWQRFLESLAAKPSTQKWLTWDRWAHDHRKLEEWCLDQTWHADVLPYLKYLSIQRPKGFSQSERLHNLPFLSLVGWTRAYLTPPLEHLKVWEGRRSMGDIAVDYVSIDHLDKHLGVSGKEYTTAIVMGMVTRCLILHGDSTSLLQLHSTVLFRQLHHLELTCFDNREIPILPYLEQIKRLEIRCGLIPEYSLNIDLPLTHTLECLELRSSASSWMLGRTFKVLRKITVFRPLDKPENQSSEGLQADLPACIEVELKSCPMDYLRFLSCPNVQILRWLQPPGRTIDLEALDSFYDSVLNSSCLKQLYISISSFSELDSWIQFVFCDASSREIREVEVKVWFITSSEAPRFFDQTVGHQQCYEKWWKTFTVTEDGARVIVKACM